MTLTLDLAFLCPDCRAIGDNNATCEKCGNKHLMSLARVLDRDEKPARIEEDL